VIVTLRDLDLVHSIAQHCCMLFRVM
jgi:hypothetical protein